ncbi:MAG TPA: c-type cytochrome, partial [Steroidobacteraceae bacterium]|nr:c-type cytochrome [Steroidobacteraceae bacterium]
MKLSTPVVLALALAALPAVGGGEGESRAELRSALGRTPDFRHGEQLYETCAACHGSNGGGVSDGSVPAIAGQHYRVIVKQLVDFRHDRRWDIRMEHFTDRHRLPGPQDLADLAAYVSVMQRTNHPGTSDPELLRRGAQVYFAGCATCHGPTGEGDDEQL